MASEEKPPGRELHVLTLNCWGLLHISKLRSQRIGQIASSLASMTPPPDVVGLQELFTQADYAELRRRTRGVLPHGKFYHSGAFGGGLAILSRWPLVASSMHAYPLNGRPTAFWHGDWYVGKGVAHARVRVGGGPSGQSEEQEAFDVDVFNTHTHASYGSHDAGYACHTAAQAWHMAKLLRDAARGRGGSGLVLALGDFNMLPLSLAHRIITSHAPVVDAWRALHPSSSLGASHHPAEAARGLPVPSAEFNLRENGATSNNVTNTWRWPKDRRKALSRENPCPVDPDTPDPHGQRLDYVFFSPRQSSSGWAVKDAAVAMTHRHSELQVSLSDHYAVHAVLERREGISGAAAEEPDPAIYDEILTLVDGCVARERREQSWRAWHFFLSLLVFVGCLVAVWFSPHNGVAFALVVVSTLALATGVVNGLLSLLFFGSELRGLAEFEWEIRNAKAVALGTLDSFDDEFDADTPKGQK